jgi:tRNA(Ile)-lysidine synthase TilS/MesJ
MKSITVLTLQNGKKLNKNQFVSYFEKKVLYTTKKYHFFENERKNFNKNAASKLNFKDFFVKNKINHKIISHESLDDISLQVLQIFMSRGKIKKKMNDLLPLTHKNKKIILRPFYFMTKKEIFLYATIKNIKFNEKKVQKKDEIIFSWLDDFEKKHLEVKNAIVNSILKIEES